MRFRPVHYTPFYGRDQGKALGGVEIHLRDPARAPLTHIQLHALAVHNALYPERDPFRLAAPDRLRMFDRVAGGARLREAYAAEAHGGGDTWQAAWARNVTQFTERARAYASY